jgi:hypothetical protein
LGYITFSELFLDQIESVILDVVELLCSVQKQVYVYVALIPGLPDALHHIAAEHSSDTMVPLWSSGCQRG